MHLIPMRLPPNCLHAAACLSAAVFGACTDQCRTEARADHPITQQGDISTPAQRSAKDMENEKPIFRQIAFPLSAFDYLKHYQREHLARTGQCITNNEALASILKEHKTMTVESGVQRYVSTDSPQGT